jgi:hypothetical protein
MPKVGKYCKAYSVNRFRQFEKWVESESSVSDTKEAGIHLEPSSEALLDEHKYLFIHENLIVTRGIFTDEKIVFDQITPEWENFCRNELKFEVPAEFRD